MKIAAYISSKNINDSHFYAALFNLAKAYSHIYIECFSVNAIGGEQTILPNLKITLINNIGNYFWRNYKLPQLIVAQNFDYLISDNPVALNLKINIPQYLFVEHYDVKIIAKNKATKLAKKIFFTHKFIESELSNRFATETIYHPLKQSPTKFISSQLETLKEKYCNQYDYILFNVNTSSEKYVTMVLKAYSLLKKWQKTTIKLLLLVDELSTDNLIPNFSNYKHKQDVLVILRTSQNEIEITAAAFMQLFFSKHHKFSDAFIAMQNNVPLIAEDLPINNNFFDNAAVFSQANELSLYESMEQLYKNEFLKKEIQYHAQQLLLKYDTQQVTENLFNGIVNK